MRSREFTSSEQASFALNPNISHVTKSSIIYTQEFKEHAVEQYYSGVPARKIFDDADIDISLFPADYARHTIKRWRNARNQGASVRSRKGRPKNPSNMTVTEMEARIAYLEAENDFLKKLRALEESE